ncbi:MAG: DUF3501 family protein [Gammaproteobacteria bacterium]|nr:DUF3501 family protein [Gammaproteobacteria bacterium]
MKTRLTRTDLMPLERYHIERQAFRRRVIEHKAVRQVFLGAHVCLTFEDALTIQYQIQEMLRVERIFEADAIQEELDVYNALMPDGDNWKATMMIEYEDSEERRVALERLVDIEGRVWIKLGVHPPIFAIADEDLERSRDNKTSAVHFLRFQLTPASVAAAKAGSALGMGVDHPAYSHSVVAVSEATRRSLINELA